MEGERRKERKERQRERERVKEEEGAKGGGGGGIGGKEESGEKRKGRRNKICQISIIIKMVDVQSKGVVRLFLRSQVDSVFVIFGISCEILGKVFIFVEFFFFIKKMKL